MDKAPARFGEVLDFGPCLVGKNLNLLTVRGSAPLDELAYISFPDVFDQEDNPTGTQRDLDKKHAESCFAFAMASQDIPPDEEPRAFPEIILNARDASVLEFYDLEDPTTTFVVDSLSDGSELEKEILGTRVRVNRLDLTPRTSHPQISRVDGNHRLAGVDAWLKEQATNGIGDDSGELELPVVPFSLLVALNPEQEAHLFRDVNAEHKGMETAHLATLDYRLHDETELQKHKLPLWLAMQLAIDGHAFEGIVFFGGSAKGLRRAGLKTSIRINTLRSAIALQIRTGIAVTDTFKDDPERLLTMLNNYWTAVRETFPEAWEDRKNYILLQSIGLNAFAIFGGDVLERAVADGGVSIDDFRRYLAPIKSGVSLARKDWPGVAGAGGATEVANKLKIVASPAAVNLERVRDQLSPDSPTIDQRLTQ